MIAYTSSWMSEAGQREYIRRITEENVTELYMFMQWEAFEIFTGRMPKLMKTVVDILNKRNMHDIPITIVSSRPRINYHTPLVSNKVYSTLNLDIQHWPTFFTNNHYQITYHLYNKHNVTEPQKLFSLFNGAKRRHRSYTIDVLCRENILDHGAVSWFCDPLWSDYANDEYHFKWWTEKNLHLDDADRSSVCKKIPTQFFTSFMNLVSETNTSNFFFTEKTAKPLMYGLPFLVIGCRHYHLILETFGFERYAEIFNYNFDAEPNEEKRIEMLIRDNLVPLSKLSMKELSNMRNNIKYKIEHNKQLALDHATKIRYHPRIVRDMINNNDPKYRDMKNEYYFLNPLINKNIS